VTGIAIALSTEAAQREQLFALQLRPNHERAVQAALRIKGYTEFLPLYRKWSRWSDRVKDLDLPLFPGHIFSKFEAQRRLRLPILVIPSVVRHRRVGGHPEPVNESELTAVRRFVESGAPVMPLAIPADRGPGSDRKGSSCGPGGNTRSDERPVQSSGVARSPSTLS
jgi:hypothetical protein